MVDTVMGLEEMRMDQIGYELWAAIAMALYDQKKKGSVGGLYVQFCVRGQYAV